MATFKMPLPPILTERINVAEAPATGLRELFALPPDGSDKKAYVVSELIRRWDAWDEYLGLDTEAPDLPGRRIRALVEYCYGIAPDDADWSERFSLILLVDQFPGFSIKPRGRPSTWTRGLLFDLVEDFLAHKKRHPELDDEARWIAFRRHHRDSWGRYGIPALRKAYARGRALGAKYPKPKLAKPQVSRSRP